MEDGVLVYLPNKKNFEGRVTIGIQGIDVKKTSRIISGIFGALGHALDKGKDALYFKWEDITSVEEIEKAGCMITLKNGEAYKIIFNHPKKSLPYLMNMVQGRVLRSREVFPNTIGVKDRHLQGRSLPLFRNNPTKKWYSFLSFAIL